MDIYDLWFCSVNLSNRIKLSLIKNFNSLEEIWYYSNYEGKNIDIKMEHEKIKYYLKKAWNKRSLEDLLKVIKDKGIDSINFYNNKYPNKLKNQIDAPAVLFYKGNIERLNKKDVVIPNEYLKKMLNHSWPGNIRELENFIELIINTECIPSGYFGDDDCENEALIDINSECLKLEYAEKEHLTKVIRRFKGNITRSAEALGIRRNTLYSKIKKYEIQI